MAQTNGFIKMAVGALVVIIVAAGVILPLFASAEKTAGAVTTYENTNAYNYSFALTDSDVIFEMTVGEGTDRTYTLNGETYTPGTLSLNIIVSDGATLNVPKSGTTSTWGFTYYLPDGSEIVCATTDGDCGVKFSNGKVYSLDSSDVETQISTYSWVLYNNNDDGDWVLFTQGNSATTPFYVNSSADVICGGNYTSGSNDTYYTYKDGDLTLYDSQYTGDVSVTSSLVDGTTDIYLWSNFSINVNGDTDENFVPYWFFVKGTITGHEASGLTYTIVAILPVIILVGVLMMIVTAFISNRRA